MSSHDISPEVSLEELEQYTSPYLSFGGWLTWERNYWYRDVLNFVLTNVPERPQAIADVHSLTFAIAVERNSSASQEDASQQFIEAAWRLGELPLDSPISIEVHALIDSLRFAAGYIRHHRGEDSRHYNLSPSELLDVV